MSFSRVPRLGLVLVGCLAAAGWATPSSAIDRAIERLKAGNAAFVADPAGSLPITPDARRASAQDQTPFASVLSCADSRVPPEVIFRTGLGELFVVRAAGQVTDRSILASLEYSAELLRVPLIVVMGHESCGAVAATIATPPGKSLSANLDYLFKAIRPSVSAARPSDDAVHLRAAILENVEESINHLIDDSDVLRRKFEGGTIGFVGAYYELASGRVIFSEAVSRTTHK
ncbi:MAG TPA: carbonic anhydrase [Vicinamibacterales bacterium]|nr:carbonic anhydrase [Vicinamibacterales bacterium]